MKETHQRIIAGVVVVLMLAIVFYGSNMGITGFGIYDPDSAICHASLDSCIDMNGDGMYDDIDQEIFACLLGGPSCPDNDLEWEELYGHNESYFRLRADFNGDGFVTAEIDFQRCFVPIRDDAIDKGIEDEITCNVDISDEDVIENLETSCWSGCPDLNGDGYVDEDDLNILVELLGNNDYDDTYPMADMNNDSAVGWEDKDCMAAFFERYVLCNMPVYYQHNSTEACADLFNTDELYNDGFVNGTDVGIYQEYISLGEKERIDFNDDNKTNWEDKWIFDQYKNYKTIVNASGEETKVVDCNLYHAPWHTGGVDQNNSDADSITGNETVSSTNNVSQIFLPFHNSQFSDIKADFAYLTKVRLYLENTGSASETVQVIASEINLSELLANNKLVLTQELAKTTIEPPEVGLGKKWVTAYFANTPRLKRGEVYAITLVTEDSSDDLIWHYTDRVYPNASENLIPNSEFKPDAGPVTPPANWVYNYATPPSIPTDVSATESSGVMTLEILNDDIKWLGVRTNSSDNPDGTYNLKENTIYTAQAKWEVTSSSSGTCELHHQARIPGGSDPHNEDNLYGKNHIINASTLTLTTIYPERVYRTDPGVEKGYTSIIANPNYCTAALDVDYVRLFEGIIRNQSYQDSTPIDNKELLYEVWMTTAYADLNGDGIVDNEDQVIILNIPDRLTPNGTEFWNPNGSLFDLESDNIINQLDINVFKSFVNSFENILQDLIDGIKKIIEREIVDEQLFKNGFEWFGDDKKLAQQIIIPDTTMLYGVDLKLAMDPDRPNNEPITVELTDDNHDVVGSAIIDPLLDSTPKWYTANFTSPVPVVQNQLYYIEVSTSSTKENTYKWYAVYDDPIDYDIYCDDGYSAGECECTGNETIGGYQHNLTSVSISSPGVVTKFTFDFNVSNLCEMTITYDNSTGYNSVVMSGIDLPGDETKTAYLPKISSTDEVCVKDAPIVSILEMSSNCNGDNEFLLNCSSAIEKEGRKCEYNIGETTRIITGLKHSGIREEEPPCVPTGVEMCDGEDNDCNGQTDERFEGDDCQELCISLPKIYGYDMIWINAGGQSNCCGDDPNEGNPYEASELNCTDENDNDCDGLTDCQDDDCAQEKECITNCIDEDGDGHFNDTEEPCALADDCDDDDDDVFGGNEEDCGDGKDNDCDGYTDCADTDCIADPTCLIDCWDPDGDGYGVKFDYLGGTVSIYGCEHNETEDCNNYDTDINPGEDEICDNGFDDDCDGNHDCEDSDCTTDCDINCGMQSLGDRWFCPVSEEKGICQLGVKICVYGFPSEFSDCTAIYTKDTEDNIAKCKNGIDDDCDGKVDCDDVDCINLLLQGPEDCDDKIDNNCNGDIDCDDQACENHKSCA